MLQLKHIKKDNILVYIKKCYFKLPCNLIIVPGIIVFTITLIYINYIQYIQYYKTFY